MLGVTLYLRSQYPVGGYWADNDRDKKVHAPMYMKKQWGKQLREHTQPFRQDQHRLMMTLKETFLSDSLDSDRMKQLADSLATVKGDLHRQFIVDLIDIHPHLTPSERIEMFSRVMRKQMGKGPPPGGRPSPGGRPPHNRREHPGHPDEFPPPE